MGDLLTLLDFSIVLTSALQLIIASLFLVPSGFYDLHCFIDLRYQAVWIVIVCADGYLANPYNLLSFNCGAQHHNFTCIHYFSSYSSNYYLGNLGYVGRWAIRSILQTIALLSSEPWIQSS